MLRRPLHLQRRSIRRSFGEPIKLIRTAGTRDSETGRYTETETETDAVAATAPATREDARVRQLEEGGVLLADLRMFWTVQTLQPAVEGSGAGDIVVWPATDGERWRVRATGRWGGFSESIGVRQEAQ